MVRKIVIGIMVMLAVAMALAVPVWGQMSQLGVRDFEVKSVVPVGLRSVRATVELKMVNPGGVPFEMKDIDLIIYRNGEAYVHGTCPLIPVAPGVSTVKAVGVFRLADGVSLWSAIRSVLNVKLEEYTADISLISLGDWGTEQDFLLRGMSVAWWLNERKK